MDSKHIERDFSAHQKQTVRLSGEYCGLEIFSFDPKYTQYYLREDNTLLQGDNCKGTSWRSWSCYRADSTNKDMKLSVEYNAKQRGEYRIDLLYEQNKSLYTSKDLTGSIEIADESKKVYEDEKLKFDGEDNCIKRIPLFLNLNKGMHTINIEVPPNCYFYGIIVRKTIKYTCNNYYGADVGKDSGNMMFTEATLSISDMIKPSELSLTVLYDDAYKCDESPSGFYIDYMDEVNFYVKNNDGVVERVFGGYVSSILPNANLTQLSIHCADRLVDGQNKYVLDELKLQGGTKNEKKRLVKNFKSYTHILKYLCNIHETTLKSNISSNYLVEGEKFSKGFTITYGKKKSIKKIPTTNGYSTTSNNHITIRNKPSGAKKQVWTLYDASKHSKVAPNITDKPYMHITYGLGSPKTTHETKTTETVDVSDITAGTQKFGKCGRSEDGKYLMAIGKISGSKKTNLSKTSLYKTIFENKCPYCGSKLVWDSGRTDTNCVYCGGYNGSKRTWGDISETEITCTSCCSDFDAVTGYEKITNPKKHLTKVSSSVKSSKAEQDKLHNGKMSAIPKTGVSITPDDLFEAITHEAFKYKYSLGGNGQTYAQMKKSGHGDCHGFSDLILTFFKKYNVTSKIVEYRTSYSNSHHSVLYKNEKGQWVDFPYRKYGWNTKFKNMLNNTSGSKTGSYVDGVKGNNIGTIKASSKKTTKKQTTKVTTTKNYDKDKPFQGYLKIVYSHDSSLDAPKKSFYMRFTQRYTKGDSVNEKGFPLYWVNNNTKKATFVGSDGKPLNIVEWLRSVHSKPNEKFYLQSIQMIAPKKVATDNDKETDWYKYDKTTHDESSCKMDIYQITFDDNGGSNASELSSCGKTVNSMLQEVVETTGYVAYMTYGKHRKDDKIHFKVNNSSNISFTATEGNNNNILDWNSISYNPLTSLFNMSIQVFKIDEKNTDNYYYVDSRIPKSILSYGEQATLQTSNEPISSKEAYFNARMNPKFNGEQTYTFTIITPNFPSLHLGEFVKILANAKKLNTIKEVKSLKLNFNENKTPRLRTEIGLDELSPYMQMQKNIRNLRKNAKKETTSFSSSAVPIADIDLYEWDR